MLGVEFGERVLAQPLRTLAEGRGNLEERFVEGIVVGYRERSEETIVATADGIIRSRSIRRRPPEERWSRDAVIEVSTRALD